VVAASISVLVDVFIAVLVDDLITVAVWVPLQNAALRSCCRIRPPRTSCVSQAALEPLSPEGEGSVERNRTVMRLRNAQKQPAANEAPASAIVRVHANLISISNLSKTYASGLHALKHINLEIRRGEIFALLGPNGAGKTTLIGTVCGLVNPTAGSVTVDGHDIIRDYRAARSLIGLVPQELTTDAFETVWATVSFSRGLFGKPPNPGYIEKVLTELSLWQRKDSKIMTLSGGMKRRVLIAKALSHEPQILFLDEPTAGVDVELRRDMWELVRSLRATGVTVILTTHYIEEAEDMADRIGVISKGEIILVEDKAELMRKLGRKQLALQLQKPLERVPERLAAYNLNLSGNGAELIYTYDTQSERTGIVALLDDLNAAGIEFKDLQTTQSSLEDIFVGLVKDRK
jgi:ABC-2 type transport system ATP-binding protein